MNLSEFRRRWTDGGDPKTESSIDDSRTDGVDDWRRLNEQPVAWQPVRLRPKYVPEADSDVRGGWVRQSVARGLIVALVFVAALIVLSVMFDHLPAYLTTYVFDR